MLPRVPGVIRGAGHSVDLTACEPDDPGCLPFLARVGITPRIRFDASCGKLAGIRVFGEVIRAHPAELIWTSLNPSAFPGLVVGARNNLPVVCWKNAVRARASAAG